MNTSAQIVVTLNDINREISKTVTTHAPKLIPTKREAHVMELNGTVVARLPTASLPRLQYWHHVAGTKDELVAQFIEQGYDVHEH